MIVEFSALAHFAEERTGTDKLGVLKLDIDDLGKTFEGFSDWHIAKKASIGVSWFFGEFMHRMLESPFSCSP